MALGKVSVNNLNLGQGAVSEIERYFLFIGPAAKNVGKLVPLDTQSDLDVQLGVADSDLKTQILAARSNGGDRWACIAAPIAGETTWQQALESAIRSYSFEAVVIVNPVTSQAELSAMHVAANDLSNKLGRRVFVLAATAGIAPQLSWSAYVVEQKAIVGGLVAPRVLPVPQLHGNNLGVLAGRLANAAVSIADTPMRVATG
ncbi:prophage PSPPH06 tail sheath protein, partial [Pseudomonas syringae pv. actinidiae ICMP 19079]